MATPPTQSSSPFEPLRPIYRFLTSFKLATVILVLMTLVTLLGTLGQVELGLHAAKEKYFHSYFFSDKIFGIPVLLPGGLVLMSLLFINMTLGALVKVRKRWRGFGLLVSHFGMLMLLFGGFVTWAFATDGYMAMYPGMKTNRVESYREWELEILKLGEDGKATELKILPAEKLRHFSSANEEKIPVEGFPFDLQVTGYEANARPIPTSAPMAAGIEGREIDGFKLASQPRAKEAEQNLPGCFVKILPKEGGEPIETILWAGSYRFDPKESPMPFHFELGGQTYGLLLAKKSWTVPFSVQLDEFIFEKHPGVSTARNYESRVTRFESDKPEKAVEIKMNEPMRYAGYTFFQESFGPANAGPEEELYSQFAVANNPADQWPLWALVITFFGLFIHFCMSLVGFIEKSFRTRTTPTKP